MPTCSSWANARSPAPTCEKADQADEGRRIPVLLSNKYEHQCSGPLIGDILRLAKLWMDGSLDVVAELMIEGAREKDISHERNQLYGTGYSVKNPVDE